MSNATPPVEGDKPATAAQVERDAITSAASVEVQPPGADTAPIDGTPGVPTLERDDTIAPRPEEDIADAGRAHPDAADRGDV